MKRVYQCQIHDVWNYIRNLQMPYGFREMSWNWLGVTMSAAIMLVTEIQGQWARRIVWTYQEVEIQISILLPGTASQYSPRGDTRHSLDNAETD